MARGQGYGSLGQPQGGQRFGQGPPARFGGQDAQEYPTVDREKVLAHPGVELRANLKPISHRCCYLFEVAFVWELTEETIAVPLGCLQGGGGPSWP